MKFSTVAKAMCANFQPNASCLGCSVEPSLAIRRCSPRLICRLAEKPPQRCEHFEDCVLPQQPELIEKYRRAFNLPAVTIRQCSCGAPMQRGRRFCTDCALRRRHETYRASKRAARQKAVGCSTVELENTAKSLTNPRGFPAEPQNRSADSHPSQIVLPTVDTPRGVR